MELGYSHAQGQRVLRQRNLLALATLLLGALVIVLFPLIGNASTENTMILALVFAIESDREQRRGVEGLSRDDHARRRRAHVESQPT